MEIILRQQVDKLGHAGDVVEVKDGYARNYLLPQGLAYPATEGNKRRVEAEKKARGEKLAAQQEDAEQLAATLTTLELNFTAKAGEGDKLFGSITSADIADKLAEHGVTIDKRQVELDEPIKMVGVYKVPLRLHPEVRGAVRVWVVKE